MDSNEVMSLLSQLGAIITNSHVVYTSGRHGSAYVNKDALYVHANSTSQLCQIMASTYNPDQVDIVAGPTIGGVVLSQWVAYHLNLARTSGETLSIYAEEENEGETKKRIFKRGYDQYIPGKNVVVVEDILTTGGSARKVIEAVRASGGNVLGLSVLCNRGNIKSEDVGGVPIHALTEVTLDSWEPQECPLCSKPVPINTAVGKGKEFLQQKPNVTGTLNIATKITRQQGSTARIKFDHFTCPKCQTINIELDKCHQCGENLKNNWLSGNIKPANRLPVLNNALRQQPLLVVAALILVCCLWMMMNINRRANTHHVATSKAPYQESRKDQKESQEKESTQPSKEFSKTPEEIAAQYAGFKIEPATSYTYVNTTSETPGILSFGLDSIQQNQKVRFYVWDNTAPVDDLNLIIHKVPFHDFDPHNDSQNDVGTGQGIIGNGKLNWYVGRYFHKDQPVEVLVAAYRSPVPEKAIVIIATQLDSSNELDYKTTLWLIDTMAAPFTLKMQGTPSLESPTKEKDNLIKSMSHP